MDKRMSFHSKMIKLRKLKGFTQETFAAEVGVSRQSVYKWESGQSYPEVEKLLKVARTFGVTVDDMLNDDMEVGRNGEVMPLAEYLAEEERLAKEAEEKRARRAAAKAKREQREKAKAEAAEVTPVEAPLVEEREEPKAEPSEPLKEEVKEEEKEEIKEEPKKPVIPASLPEKKPVEKVEKKKGGFFGLFRRK